jgi:hypothetical protein
MFQSRRLAHSSKHAESQVSLTAGWDGDTDHGYGIGNDKSSTHPSKTAEQAEDYEVGSNPGGQLPDHPPDTACRQHKFMAVDLAESSADENERASIWARSGTAMT